MERGGGLWLVGHYFWCTQWHAGAQSTFIGRDEIGRVYLPTQLERYTATSLMMVNVVEGGGHAPPSLTSQG